MREPLEQHLRDEARATMLASLDRDRAWEQYRTLSFQTLVVALVSLGLGSLTEREDTVRTVLRRSVAALERLGFDDLLARL